MKTGWRSCGLRMTKMCDCWKKIFCFGKKKMKKSCVRGLYIARKMNSWSWNNFWRALCSLNWTGKGSSMNSWTPMSNRMNFGWNSFLKERYNLKMNYTLRRLICWMENNERLNCSGNMMKIGFGWDSWGLKMNCLRMNSWKWNVPKKRKIGCSEWRLSGMDRRKNYWNTWKCLFLSGWRR
jgi:hypothetical protein